MLSNPSKREASVYVRSGSTFKVPKPRLAQFICIVYLMDRQDYEALPLALVGAAEGIFRYYIRPELTRDRLLFLGSMATVVLADQLRTL